MKIAVLGAGAWGTALALSFAQRHTIALWTWEEAHAAAMRQARENRLFLPGHPLAESIAITAEGF